MRWSTAQLAPLLGTTARTLRWYDEVGLVRPAATGAGGLRLYGPAERDRLQRALALRRLGLGLADVAEALDGDAAAVLRRHRAALDAEQHRLTGLAADVDAALGRLDGGGDVVQEDEAARQARWEAEAAERWPEVQARPVGPDVDAAFAAVEERVAGCLRAGLAPDDAAVLDVLADHHAVVSRAWVPDGPAYAGLGELYAEHADFRTRYEARQPGLADYLRDAMAAYAAVRLT